MRALVLESKPRHLVIDPLSALSQSGREADAESAAVQVLDLAKSLGITLVSTSLLGGPSPLVEQTPFNISTIADTWMQVSYLNQGGERNRALTIVKARGIGHSNQIRELVLTDRGVDLADVYAVAGEVLMGTLRWEKENEARRAAVVSKARAVVRERKAEMVLAETKARLEALAHELELQEAELDQLRADASAEADGHLGDAEELLRRRRADTLPPVLESAEAAPKPGHLP